MKLYQNIPGVTPQNENRLNSKYWNQGKWDNFVAPHLPDDPTDMTFVEMGCNAGWFLKCAEEYGFRNVVGVEKNTTPWKVGNRYRDSIGYNYTLLKRTLGGKFGESGNFDIDEIPVADYTLMSTFHYYVDINSWLKYLDRLKAKTRYVIIVSRPKIRYIHWRPYSSLESLKTYFDGWEMGKVVEVPVDKSDPSPRELFSVTFKSPTLERIPMNKISAGGYVFHEMRELARAKDPFETEFYRKWVGRKLGRWDEKTVKYFVKLKFDMMQDVIANGLTDPIIVHRNNKLADGGHRLAVLDILGYKSVIIRRTP